MEWGPLVGGIAAVLVALIGQWAAFRRYRTRAEDAQRRAKLQLQEEARISYVTEEQLQADFRKEIREEMRRLRDKDERRDIAYRKLEDENSDLRRKMAGLEIEVMQLRALLDQHGVAAPPHAPGM